MRPDLCEGVKVFAYVLRGLISQVYQAICLPEVVRLTFGQNEVVALFLGLSWPSQRALEVGREALAQIRGPVLHPSSVNTCLW